MKKENTPESESYKKICKTSFAVICFQIYTTGQKNAEQNST